MRHQVHYQLRLNVFANLPMCLGLLNPMIEILETWNDELSEKDLENFGIGLIITDELKNQLFQERMGHNALVSSF